MNSNVFIGEAISGSFNTATQMRPCKTLEFGIELIKQQKSAAMSSTDPMSVEAALSVLVLASW